MKTYEQIKQIAEQYSNLNDKIPHNPFQLAAYFNIECKSKLKYAEVTGQINPSPAFLFRIEEDGQKHTTIYYGESAKYWRFYIFHELAHHILKHEHNGTREENEANILACCLIAPAEKIPTYLKNADDLSVFANIPTGRAEEYWEEIRTKAPFNKKSLCTKTKLTITFIFICILMVVLGLYIGNTNHNKNNDYISDTHDISQEEIKHPETTSDPVIDVVPNIVYVTPSGTKYHKQDCFHLKHSSNIKEISINDAKKEYLPCKNCFK